MKCPNCKCSMKVVETKSHYEQPIHVDQCEVCGGMWFQEDELFKINISDHGIFDEVNVKKLVKFSSITKDLKCPKDETVLEQFKDANFPKHIIIEKCSSCGGFWFNCGEFKDFQEHRKEVIEKSKEKIAEPQYNSLGSLDDETRMKIQNMLESESNEEGNRVIRSLAHFLKTPARIRPRGYAIFGRLSSIHPSSKAADTIGEVALNTVQALLRMIGKV